MMTITIAVVIFCCLFLGIELTTLFIGLLIAIYFADEFPILFLLLAIGGIAGALTEKK